MNKKKIRGWKRQIRQLERWKTEHLSLNLNRDNYSYVKIWLDPWYRLEKRNPPVWFCRMIFAALLEIYESWRKDLLSRGEPFYLKVWLFDPHFINSQVVAATGERIHYYGNSFTQNNETQSFPYQKYMIDGYNLQEYDWELCVHEDMYFELLYELSADEIESLKRKAFRVEELRNGDKVYGIKKGDVWLGTRKNV